MDRRKRKPKSKSPFSSNSIPAAKTAISIQPTAKIKSISLRPAPQTSLPGPLSHGREGARPGLAFRLSIDTLFDRMSPSSQSPWPPSRGKGAMGQVRPRSITSIAVQQPGSPGRRAYLPATGRSGRRHSRSPLDPRRNICPPALLPPTLPEPAFPDWSRRPAPGS